jgi:hypothetical protein
MWLRLSITMDVIPSSLLQRSASTAPERRVATHSRVSDWLHLPSQPRGRERDGERRLSRRRLTRNVRCDKGKAYGQSLRAKLTGKAYGQSLRAIHRVASEKRRVSRSWGAAPCAAPVPPPTVLPKRWTILLGVIN